MSEEQWRRWAKGLVPPHGYVLLPEKMLEDGTRRTATLTSLGEAHVEDRRSKKVYRSTLRV